MIHEKDSNAEQLILEAAERLFLEKGFAMTSTTEIAKEVGCNQALVHYYFRTKDKLFDAIFEKKIRLFVSVFIQPNDENLPFEEKLKKKIEAHFDVIRANSKIPFLFFNEFTTNPKKLEVLKNKIGEIPKTILFKLHKELKAEIKKGNIRPMSIIDIMLTVMSLNIALFMICPIFKVVAGVSEKNLEKLIERRKKENVLIIMRSLKP
jgi:TetR/AcrR family transcriptional regulator